jgi:hypothetical protein
VQRAQWPNGRTVFAEPVAPRICGDSESYAGADTLANIPSVAGRNRV